MRRFIALAFGTTWSTRRIFWYVATFVLLLSANECRHQHQCRPNDFLIQILWTLSGVLLLVGGSFFLNMQGLSIIKGALYLRNLRRQIDPVAEACGATASTKWFDSTWCHYYSFPDGNWVTLKGWERGFNFDTPSWNPGFEKNTPHLDVLIGAIRAFRDAQG